MVSARKVGLDPNLEYVFWSHLVESLYSNPELIYAYLVSESDALLQAKSDSHPALKPVRMAEVPKFLSVKS